jgi:glucose-6-phosphate 1-epimerase
MLPQDPLQDLNDRHALPGKLRFQFGNGGLPLAAITTPAATAQVYLHGAHVTHYQPAGQAPLLFLSENSFFDDSKPIRGGIPICLPWFSNLASDPAAPSHGTARLQSWDVKSTAAADDGSVQLVLSWDADPTTRRWFPHALAARYTVTVGPRLRLDLEVTNAGTEPFTFTEALHSYFRVADIRQVRLEGLQATDYLDKTLNQSRKNQGPHPVTFTAETDRMYLATAATIVAHDVAGGRNIEVQKSGSQSTVVWNPWADRAKALPDLGDDQWPHMLCIETANVADAAVTLAPGAAHTMTAVIHAQVR